MNPQSTSSPSAARIPLVILILGTGSLLAAAVNHFYDHEEANYRLVFGLLLPALPFLALAMLGLIRRDGDYLLTQAHLVGAGIAAFVTTAIPWTILWYFATYQKNQGVAIGAGILVMISILAIPFVMLLGGFLGQVISHGIRVKSIGSN